MELKRGCLRLVNGEKRVLLLFALLYVLLFLLFYPPFYRAPDEHRYIRGAYLLGQGVLEVSNPLYAYGFVSTGSSFASFYPPLHSVLLVPFTFLPWQGIFLSGLVLHLLNFFIFYRLLKKLNYNGLFSLLFLFFPVLVFGSRAVLSESSSLTMLLLAFYFYLGSGRRSHFLSGTFFALAVAARYTNALALLAVGIVLLFKNRKKLLRLAAGAVPIALLLMLYHFLLYGSPFATGYFLIEDFRFDALLLPFRLLYFVVLLSAVYPLMLFSLFFSKNRLRHESILLTAFFLLLWGTYWFSSIKFRPEDLVVVVNKFVPVIFLLLLAYIDVLSSLARRFRLEGHLPRALAAFAVLMLLPTLVVCSEQLERQEARFETFEQIYAETEAGSLIVVDEQFKGMQEGTVPFFTAMFFMEPFGERKLVSIRFPGYERFIEDEGSTYYMRSYFEGSSLRVEIKEWKEYLKASGQ